MSALTRFFSQKGKQDIDDLKKYELNSSTDAVIISSYNTSSNPYTVPSDGIAVITSGTRVNNTNTLRFIGVTNPVIRIETVRAGYPVASSFPVKKGQQIWSDQGSGGTDGSATFIPYK